jgi:type I restriction enzyme S subunit
MSEDPDFDMEVVEGDELGELGIDGAASSTKRSRTEQQSMSNNDSFRTEDMEPSNTRSEGFDPEYSKRQLDRLGEYVEFKNGKKPSRVLEEATDNAEAYLTVETLRDGELKYAIDESAPRASPHDVLMIMDGSGSGRVYPGRKGIISSTFSALEISQLCPEYVRYFLEHNFRRINSATKGSAVPHTDKDLVRSLEVPNVEIDEQRQIASVLYAVDQAIQKTEAIIEQAKRVKRGMMQDLFTHGPNDEETQRIRPGEFPKSWEVKALGEVANVVRGSTPDTKNQNYYGGENVWVTPNDLSNLYEDGAGKYIADSERKLTDSGVEAKSLSMVRPNSVMFTSRSYGIGKTAICTVPAATNQGITAFECESELSEEFLYYYLNHAMDYIVSISGVATFPEITKRAVEGLPIPIPDRSTQEAITSPLSRFDDLIDHEIESKEELEQLKDGLMQDLLTGEVRTVDKAIEVLDEVAAHG